MRTLAYALAATTALSGAALAETVTADEIVIVAAPLPTDASRTLQGVTVLDRAEIEQRLGLGLGETLDAAPGVASTFFGAGASRPIIRGLGEDRIRVLSNGLAQIDASSISPDHAVAAEALEAERIDVIRGPAALAFGGTAVGGVVNVIDGRIAETLPERTVSGRLYGGFATGLDLREGAGAARLASGRVVLTADAYLRETGDYEIPGYAYSAAKRAEEIEEGEDPDEFARGLAENSFTETHAIAAGLSFVFDRGFLGVSVRRNESEYGLPGHEHGHEHEDEEHEDEEPGPFVELEQTRFEMRGALRDVGPFEELRASAAVVDYEHSEIEDGVPAVTFANDGYDLRLEGRHKAFGPSKGVLGLVVSETDFAATGDIEEPFVTPTAASEIGVFLVERISSGALRYDLGLRYDRRELDNEEFGERSFDLVSAAAGVGFQASPQLFLGAQASYTERAPTEPELFSFGEHLATQSFDIGDPDLTKEKAIGLEGAARFAAGPLSLEASLFYTAFDGFVAFLPTGEEEEDLPVFRYVQRDARFIGGELGARYAILEREGLRLAADAALDLVRAEFDEGGHVPRIPPLSTRLGFDVGVASLDVRLEWERAEEQPRTAAFETTTAGYDLLNARVTLRPFPGEDRLVLLLDGRNLTDEEARVHTSFLKDQLPRPGRTVRFAILSRF